MKDDLRPFFDRYAELYMAGDVEAVADMCDVPFLALRSGIPVHLLDRQAVVEHFAHNMAGYRSAGAASAAIVEIDVREQGTEAAMVTVHWHVRAANGTMVRDFHTSYQLVDVDQPRILSYINHDQVIHEDSIPPG